MIADAIAWASCGLDRRIDELLALDRVIEEPDLDEDGRHRRAEQHVVRVLAHAAIALGTAALAQRALHPGGEIRGLPLRGATLDIVEHEGDLGIEPGTRRRGVRAQGAAVDLDRACGQDERLVAALGAGRRGIGVDADEQVGGEPVGERDALAQGQGPIRGPGQLDGDPAGAQPGRDLVRDRERHLLLVHAGAARARVRPAMAGIEHHRGWARRGRDRGRARGRLERHHPPEEHEARWQFHYM